jgi:tRNA dimethylallyltransferase
VGKSALGELIAEALGGEIVSADSMQVYRGMNVGTAKPSTASRRVPYHLLDVAEPGEAYSAARYQHDAREAIAQITAAGHVPLLVGGTGLYVRAALDEFDFPRGEQVDNPVRERYETYAAEKGPDALHALLARRDAASAALLHPNNVRRVVRALEMADQGVSYSEQASGFAARRSHYPDVRSIGLNMDRDRLYERIDARVDAMIGAGLLDEVRSLLEHGLRDALTAAQAIGYKELVPVLEDGADLGTAIQAIKQASRKYAKRQLTWFRADPRIRWLDVTELSPCDALRFALRLVESADEAAAQPSEKGTGE